MTRVALPALTSAQRARLWLSYQRYGLGLLAGTAIGVAAAVIALPVWLWLPLGALAVVPARFAAQVLARWPQKLRATRIGLHRIATGRFAPVQVRSYCGDPCFRVVAHEILAAFRAEAARADRRDMFMLVDHSTGVVVTVGADGQFRRETLGSAEERT